MGMGKGQEGDTCGMKGTFANKQLSWDHKSLENYSTMIFMEGFIGSALYSENSEILIYSG